MQLENLLVEQREEILAVRINRPKARNALDTQTLRELSEVLQKRTQDVKVVILGSSIDKVFVSGSDIREMEAMNALKFRNYVACILKKLLQ
jgi:enoyl-CoA hydratase